MTFTSMSILSPHSGNRLLLLQRLMLLRAILLGCGLLVVLTFPYLIEIQIKQTPLLMVLIVGLVWSILFWLMHHRREIVSDWVLVSHLVVDVILLMALVWFSGRATNPFIYYLLVVISISASIFSARILWAFSLGSIALYSFLVYTDFSQHLLHMPKDFQNHLLGMWINFVGSALLISFFISRMTTALRDREIQLAAAREQTLKNEQIIGIGTLAASTVHSLGTPLSTIAISLGELDELGLRNKEALQYFDIIRNQVDRCKQIMSKLSLLANNDAEIDATLPLSELVKDISEYFTLVNAQPNPNMIVEPNFLNELIPGNLLLKHALINLIDNAIHAAKSQVTVRFKVDDDCFITYIEDDGEGIPASILENIGKPVASGREEGLGIGIFLANSTVEKLGGSVRFISASQSTTTQMTSVLVKIPLQSEMLNAE